MEQVSLGSTGITTSVVGLGCGGHSRLGLSQGASMEAAARVVRAAVDMGITFIDTAEGYGTEPAVAMGLAGLPREGVVISTKTGVRHDGGMVTPAELRARLEGCLTRLGTDYVDIFHLHGVSPEDYSYCASELVPELNRLREQGKIRLAGITEHFHADPAHAMLVEAVRDGHFQVVMVGFNILNQTARESVLAPAARAGIGTLCMFAVRNALSRPESLRQAVAGMVERGKVAPGALDPEDPLGFIRGYGVGSVVEAAYRFCRHELGMEVILTGTGSVEHLADNVRSILAPPLPPELTEALRRLFSQVDDVSGN